ncbi:TSUP family transporter [Millisia brevis]|uniref:TSUP family transporter n=1 Tax=Millisia brevis TaxID=264148 RepID=UPI000AB18EEA|nr:TSUP family transporter [Millisia brevis]
MDVGVSLLAAAVVIGALVAMVTTPVGVSGAVFLLPVQVSVLEVPSPAVTPTNLLFNLVSIPGALVRQARAGALLTPLTRLLLAGTVPGVVVGSVLRVLVVPDPRTFRIVAAGLLLVLGIGLLRRARGRRVPVDGRVGPSRRAILLLALGAGLVGGVYGIGGGSLVSPVLVGRGMRTSTVAPAALTCTFVASAVGATVFAVLSVVVGDSTIAPIWSLGVALGVGGLLGGILGARLGPMLPERVLVGLLGGLAIATAGLYAVEVILG